MTQDQNTKPDAFDLDPGVFVETSDFTAHRHPVLAVPCPACRVPMGVWCRRPSEHNAWGFHVARKRFADDVFIAQHGVSASIDATEAGWVVDPCGRKQAEQGELF